MPFIDNDVATVWKDRSAPRRGDNLLAVLFWGDELQVIGSEDDYSHVDIGGGRQGWIRNLRVRAQGLLECAFIDVGQGDACLVTTPNRSRILVDGGENKLAARYLASRYWSETQAGALVLFDAIVVTHGDADHFDGLSCLVLDAVNETRERKQIRVATRRLFHNGLVKRPSSSLPEEQLLGDPIEHAGELFAPLVDDPRTVADANVPFRRWQSAIDELAKRHPVEVRRRSSPARPVDRWRIRLRARRRGQHSQPDRDRVARRISGAAVVISRRRQAVGRTDDQRPLDRTRHSPRKRSGAPHG